MINLHSAARITLKKLSSLGLLVIVSFVFAVPTQAKTMTVTKMFDTPEGTQPSGLAWFGGYLWFSSYIKNPGIYKLNTATGDVEGIYKPKIVWKNRYGGLAADQYSIVHAQANNGNNYVKFNDPNLLTFSKMHFQCRKINFSDLAILNGNIWAIGSSHSVDRNDFKLYKFSDDGKVINEWKVSQGEKVIQNFGLASDGKYLWVAAGKNVLKVSPETGTPIESYGHPIERLESLAWDGNSLWGATFYGDIYKIVVN